MKRIRHFILAIALLTPLALQAQEEKEKIGGLTPQSIEMPLTVKSSDSISANRRFAASASTLSSPLTAGEASTSHVFGYEFAGGGVLGAWKGGLVYGTRQQAYNPAFGTIASVGIGAYQHLGKRWDFTANLSLQKYTFAQRFNTFGASGSASYEASRNVGFTLFGNYESAPFFSGNHTGVRATYGVGGYMSLKTNNGKWGVDVGSRGYYDPYQQKWVYLPIVMPYYNLKGAKLGIDVGGLLYQLFQNLGSSSRRQDEESGGNPHMPTPGRMLRTVGSPMMGR